MQSHGSRKCADSCTDGSLPYHIYHSAELWVEQQRRGDGLPKVVTGYDPDPLQTGLIQSIPQQLAQQRAEDMGSQL